MTTAEVSRIGRVIQRLRWEREISQDELARRAGTSQNNVSRIENGDQQPMWPMIVKILAALDAEIVIQPREGDTS